VRLIFWSTSLEIGFSFNPQFTDDKTACMIIAENILAMLLVEERFIKTLTKKQFEGRILKF
jgi:predicted lactoylglutathione lyase